MTQSQFQFSDPALTKIIFKINHNDLLNDEEEIPVKTNTRINKQSKNTATVTLTVDVGEESEDCLFYISVAMQAAFKWDDKTPDDIVDKLLKRNAPALLLSYIRPYVAQITEAGSVKNFSHFSLQTLS